MGGGSRRGVTCARGGGRIALLEAQKHDIDAAIAEIGEFVAFLEAHPTKDR